MKRLLFCMLAVLFLSSSTQAALTYGLTKYTQMRGSDLARIPSDFFYQFVNEIETEIEASTLEGGTTLTFSTNGGTFDNATNNTFRWGELSEYLTLTFSANATAWSSTTGVVEMDFGTVVPKSDQILFDPVADPVGTVEGTVYYDSDDDNLYVRTTAGLIDLTAGAGSVTDLDTAYNGGSTMDVDTDAVTLTVSNTDNNRVLDLVQNDVTNNPEALRITNTGTGDTLQFVSTNGKDIDGSGSTWSVTSVGALIALSGDFTGAAGLTLQNDATILNDVDTEVQIGDGSEDISFGFGVADTLTLTTDTAVATWNWGDIDAHTGLESLAFDAAASTITLAADGAADDLTISVTGAQDSSLVLASAGTAADALTITASAGGIDISSQHDIDITTTGAATEDITIQNSGGSVIVTATEGVTDAIVIQATTAAGGIDITSNEDLDITTTGAAGEDITISNAGGSLILRANENDAAVIVIDTTGGGGTSESINITNDQGTAEDSIDIDSTAGGIDIDAAAGKDIALTGGQIALASSDNVASAIALTANTGATETIVVTNTQGTGEGAITLTSTAGGIDLNAATGKNIDLLGGQFIFLSNENVASAVSLTTNTGAAETIVLTNTQGTDEAAISLVSTAGGVNIDAASAKDVDIAGGQVLISSKTTGASAIALTTNQGVAETIVVTNTQGTNAAAISLQASAGGITLNGASGGVVFTAGQTRKVLIPVEDVELDGANAPTLGQNGTNGQFVVPSLEFDADGGITGDDIVFIHWVVPDGYKTDSARLNVYWSHDTAEDAADEASLDFAVNSVAPGEVLNAAGTAGVAVTTVIADASLSAGWFQKTQINIEIEDIVIGDLVTILFFVDESASLFAASGTLDVHYFELEWESVE